MKHLVACMSVLTAAFSLPALAGPPVIDGSAAGDTLYGTSALVVQDTQTGFGDANLGRPDVCNGSELDGAYGVVYQGTLYLVLAGNFETNGNKLELFFDTRPGGQNRLLSTNPGTPNVGLLRMSDDGSGNGLTFQSGFEADFWVSVSCYGDPTVVYVDYAELWVNESNPGVSYYCGAGATKCETSGGALVGGDPGCPTILCTVDNSNVAGVTGGFGSDDGSGVKTGVEIAIPLSAIGNPSGPFTITAFINGQQHDWVSNQVLGGLAGLPPDNLGEPRNVNFATVAYGIQQPFTVPAAPTPTGACCIGTTCSIKTQAQCTAQGGTYLGDNSNCDANPCDAIAGGRCCIDDGYSGQCKITTLAQCNSLGGTWTSGATCEGCPCLLPPTGACCVNNTCVIKREADCLAISGTYVGDYTNCGTVGNTPCDVGACCVDLDCSVVMRFQCPGRFIGPGSDCTDNPCAAPTIETPYVAGDFQGWNPSSDPMTETAPGSHIWQRTYTGLTPYSRHEFKITDGTWSNTIPPGPNSWFYADASGSITITYDANYYADGWSPNRDRLGLSYDKGTWTAVGDFLSELGGSDWNNADPFGTMTSQGGGIYKLEFSGIPAGTYNWKGVITGTWDSISWNERSVNTANWQFAVSAPADTVKMWVDGLTGVAKLEVISAPAYCIGDLNCDGTIDFKDINSFVLYMVNYQAWASSYPGCNPRNGDVNCDGSYPSFADINPFVSLIVQYNGPCPGPITCP